MTWLEVCEDKSLRDLPYKIETNRRGHIIMSPARSNHGRYQSLIDRLFSQLLPDWIVVVECPIETPEGVKVPDIAAASPQHKQAIIESISLNFAPEICVEVMSFSNTEEEMCEKRDLYFAKGAHEFWLCGEFGHMSFYTRTGQVEKSLLCPDFPTNIESN